MGLLAVIWGFNWPVMKIGLTEVPPWIFRACASASGAIGLFTIARFSGHALSIPRREWAGLLIVSLTCVTLFNVLTLYGVALMDSGRAAILAYTMPLWATGIGAFLLKEKLSGRALAGLILGLSAMALLFFADFDGAFNTILGPALVILGAIAWGAGTACLKYFNFSTPATVFAAWQHAIGVIPIAIVAIAWDWRNVDEVTLIPALCVAYNMFITSIFCYWAFFKIVVALPIVVSTVGLLMVPVMGVFFNALVFSVSPETSDYLALGVVAVSVYLVMRRPGVNN